MNADDVRRALQRAIDKEGTAAAWCQKNETARGYVSDVLSGRQEPAGKLLDALGIERVVSYRKIRRRRIKGHENDHRKAGVGSDELRTRSPLGHLTSDMRGLR